MGARDLLSTAFLALGVYTHIEQYKTLMFQRLTSLSEIKKI